MESSKHTFNVVFKMQLRSPTSPYEITNLYTFHVLPVYWETIIVPGKGFVYGWVGMSMEGRDVISPSAVGIMTTTACSIPTMIYSASMILSACTVFAASPVGNVIETIV
jgi:hypothetical protein